MKCRKLYKTDTNYNLVFFKSMGVKFPRKIYLSLSTKGEIEKRTVTLVAFDDDTKTQYKTIDFTFTNSKYNINFSCGIVVDRENIFNSQIENIKFSRNNTLENVEYDCSFIMENEEIKNVKENGDIEYKQYNIYSFSFSLPENIFEYEFEYTDTINRIPFKDFSCAVKTDDNYAVKQEGVSYGLIQRLSIIKGELWYQINHGLPLLDKVRNKQILDSVIINIILNHPDVQNIIYFESEIDKHTYKYFGRISTIYNAEIEINSVF